MIVVRTDKDILFAITRRRQHADDVSAGAGDLLELHSDKERVARGRPGMGVDDTLIEFILQHLEVPATLGKDAISDRACHRHGRYGNAGGTVAVAELDQLATVRRVGSGHQQEGDGAAISGELGLIAVPSIERQLLASLGRNVLRDVAQTQNRLATDVEALVGVVALVLGLDEPVAEE